MLSLEMNSEATSLGLRIMQKHLKKQPAVLTQGNLEGTVSPLNYLRQVLIRLFAVV